MKKLTIAVAVIIVIALTSLTVISQSTTAQHTETELVKINKAGTGLANKGFTSQRNDLSSAD